MKSHPKKKLYEYSYPPLVLSVGLTIVAKYWERYLNCRYSKNIVIDDPEFDHLERLSFSYAKSKMVAFKMAKRLSKNNASLTHLECMVTFLWEVYKQKGRLYEDTFNMGKKALHTE